MKKQVIISSILLFFGNSINAQQKLNDFSGIWVFIPIEGSGDTIFKEYKIILKDKSIELTYWNDSKKTSIYGTPFTYYGFWDVLIKEPQPKHISELKPTGKYLFFYDSLIKDKNQKNKIGYDSLGNLYQATRRCSWTINDNLSQGLPLTTLSLYLANNGEPDVYKKVNKIPDYVLLSLKKNKEHWQRYLDFIEHKELKIKELKTNIHSSLNKPTKMYLIKNDEVEIVEEKGDWVKIRYYGKNVVEGWIKKSDVE
jgi:hypothetical protein